MLVLLGCFVGTASLLSLPEYTYQMTELGGQGTFIIEIADLAFAVKFLFAWIFDTHPLMGFR